MRFFSTFTGIGGFEIPLLELGHECVGYSEIDKWAVQIYASHFPSHRSYGDITRIAADSLPDFDLLCGGFPCQAFSVAGKRRGFLDTRGTLFFDVCRIAKEKRPRLLLLENVKGLLSHDSGNTFRTILSSLDGLGYDAEWQVCNSRHFGVPQNRESVYIVGHLRGEHAPEVFPLFGTDGSCPQELASTTVDANYGKGIDDHGARTAIVRWVNSETRCVIDQTASSLRASGGTDIRERSVILDLKANESSTHRGTISDAGYAKTLDHDCAQADLTKAAIRRLTPIECERLQGFPDNWTAGVSDTQRYKCCGNAVTTNVVREIAKRLI